MSGDGSSRQMPLQVLLRFGDSAQKVSKPKSESRMRPNPIIFRFQTLPSNIASLRKFRNCRGMSAALFAFQSAVFPFFGQKKFCHVYPLEFQQAHFYIEPSGVSREISVRTDHPVAGNYNGYRVVADRLPDGLRRHLFRSEPPGALPARFSRKLKVSRRGFRAEFPRPFFENGSCPQDLAALRRAAASSPQSTRQAIRGRP